MSRIKIGNFLVEKWTFIHLVIKIEQTSISKMDIAIFMILELTLWKC